MSSLRGFGMTWTKGGPPRGWYVGPDGVKRWLDNDEPVEAQQKAPNDDRPITKAWR